MAAFTLAAGVILWYAVPDGSYDVRRQEDAVAVWWVIGLGAALGLLPRTRLRRGSRWVLIPLVLLVAWTALALLWTSSDERTLAEVVRVVHYAGIVLLIWCVVSPSTWRPAAAGIAAGAIAVCALAVASRLAPDQFSDEVAKAFGSTRLSFPLGYWNAVAAWGAMSATMALVWSAHARSLAVRAASLAAVPLAALVVYLTYSRAGVGGIAVGLLAVLALSVNRWTVAVHALAAGAASALVIKLVRDRPEIADGTGTEGAAVAVQALAGAAILCALAVAFTRVAQADRRWRLPLGAARAATLSLVAVGLVAFAVLGRAPASEAWDEFRNGRVATAPSEAEPSDARLGSLKGNRYDVWSSAVGAFRSAPLKGIGPGTFEFSWNRDEGGPFLRDAHSVYLEQAAELGLPGVALTTAVLLALGFLGAMARFRPDPSRAGAAVALVAAFIVYLFHAGLDWMWESTAVSVLALAAIALAVGSRARLRGAPGPRVRVGLAVVALCLRRRSPRPALDYEGACEPGGVQARGSQAGARAGRFGSLSPTLGGHPLRPAGPRALGRRRSLRGGPRPSQCARARAARLAEPVPACAARGRAWPHPGGHSRLQGCEAAAACLALLRCPSVAASGGAEDRRRGSAAMIDRLGRAGTWTLRGQSVSLGRSGVAHAHVGTRAAPPGCLDRGWSGRGAPREDHARCVRMGGTISSARRAEDESGDGPCRRAEPAL